MAVIRLLLILTLFLIQSFAGIPYSMGGALNSMTPPSLELVNKAFTFATLPDKKSKIIFQIN